MNLYNDARIRENAGLRFDEKRGSRVSWFPGVMFTEFCGSINVT